jgi:uncharacterized protein YbjT (DUF2867 family)
MQPMVSDDVAVAVTDVALGQPANGMIEIAGPDQFRQDELVRRFFKATGDSREIVTDENTGYFGIKVDDESLVPGPGGNARIGPTHYADWLKRSAS